MKKYNSTMDKMLEGAEFELIHKDYSDGEYKQVNDNIYKTDKNGEIYISNLPPGEYYLLEVKVLKDMNFLITWKIENTILILDKVMYQYLQYY